MSHILEVHDKTMEVDVLIVGAGPAGLMMALWMARQGISTCLIDKKPRHTGAGFADGLECRSFEILDSFGLAEKIWAEANQTIELCLWETNNNGIRRISTLKNNAELSRFQEGTLGQGRIEEHLLGEISKSPHIKIFWNTRITDLQVDMSRIDDFSAHCLSTVSQIQGEHAGVNSLLECRSVLPEILKVSTKFIVGCDGAHSWVRKKLGLKAEGVGKDESWGVLDCIPITNFPDIRKRCIVKSSSGNIMIIPRERRLVRIYIQLVQEQSQQYRIESDSRIFVNLVASVLRPYTFDTVQIEWSTIYNIGHRICPTYSTFDRIFLAGDAVHTHSPKAGKGMNLSMQDTYNLGWKLGSVLKGTARSSILQTYQAERLPVAQGLVAFDKRLYEEMARLPNGCTDWHPLKAALKLENTSQNGASVVYGPSILVMPTEQASQRFIVGARVPSSTVIRQSDARPFDIQKLLAATGRWYLLVFSGNIALLEAWENLHQLSSDLSAAQLPRFAYDYVEPDQDQIIYPFLIHSASRDTVQAQRLPAMFMPPSQSHGSDYDRVFTVSDAHCSHDSALIRQRNEIVLVRPDQHVALTASFEQVSILKRFIAGFT